MGYLGKLLLKIKEMIVLPVFTVGLLLMMGLIWLIDLYDKWKEIKKK